jgi:hypothetical protein
MTDNVLQPKHYMQGSHECIDEIKAMLTPDEFKGFLKGNIIKYRYRANLKNGEEDLAKADNYAYYLINGHFCKDSLSFSKEKNTKDKIALFKLNELLKTKTMAGVVYDLLSQKALSEDTTETLKKIASFVDFQNSESFFASENSIDYSRFVVKFFDSSKIMLSLNQASYLEMIFTAERINCIESFKL